MSEHPIRPFRPFGDQLVNGVAALVLISVPVPVLAETSEADNDIIVTARKREELLSEVPLSLSVVTGAEINKRDLRNASDLTAIAPNLQTPRNPVLFSAPTFFIRGVGQGDHNWNTENGVAVFVDDVYLQSTSAAWIDMLDIERIEVLRGPQGTLYGRNSTSGAIKFVSRKPDPSEIGGYSDVSFGSHSRIDVRAGLNLPAASGAAAIKLNVFRSGSDGFLTRVDTANQTLDQDLAKDVNFGARLAALWNPGSRVELELAGHFVRRENGMNIVTPIVPDNFSQLADPGALLSAILSKRGNVNFVPLYGVNRAALEPLTVGGSSGHTGGGVTFKASLDTSAGVVRSISAWNAYKEDFTSQLGGRGTPSTLFGVTLYGHVDTPREKVDQFTQEVQLVGQADSQFDYTIGAYFFHNSWRESEYGATNGVPANLSPFVIPGQTQSFGGSFNDIDQWTTSWALYANLDWHMTDALTVSVGGRQTWDRKHLEYASYFEDHEHLYPDFPIDTRKSWNRFTPRVGISWQAGQYHLVYANWAKGYKVGNVEGARSVIASAAANWLAPELATTWEAGLKSGWLDGKMTTNLAAFTSYNKGRTDLISPDFVASSNIRSSGVEAEVTLSPTNNLSIYANGGLLWAHYRNASANHPIFAPDPSGFAPGYDADPVMTPKYTFSAGAQYKVSLPGESDLTLNASVRAVAKHFHALGINNYDSELVKAYSNFDSSASWENKSGRIRLTAGVHNLFDKTYWQTGFFGSIPEFAGRYYADGRSWYLQLNYSF